MENFNLLPKDIVFEILYRVPAESILECKLVSKSWKNLLQHSSFPQMHLNHLNDLDYSHDSSRLSFIFYTKACHKEPFYYTEYDENSNCFIRTKRINFRPNQFCSILGSCNGLVCFNAFNDNFHLQPSYVCNPITREYIVLPQIERKIFLSGFGYIHSTNEYKVVRVSKDKRDPNYQIVQVYTLGSGIGWRNTRKMDYDVIDKNGVFVNGAIHWLARSEGTVVAFDLSDEEFLELPSPPRLPIATIELCSLCGSLCACYGCFELRVLKKNKNNYDAIWRKMFGEGKVIPISFTKTGDLLCYVYRDNNVYRYSPKASSSRKLVTFGYNFNAGVSHKNTLVSLKALGEVDTKLMDSGESARSGDETKTSDHGPIKQKEEKDL